jgi:hypothetical protein
LAALGGDVRQLKSHAGIGDEMKKKHILFLALLGSLLVVLEASFGPGGRLIAKEKNPPTPANDPTAKLFNLLDNSYGGKLSDFYVFADVYKDPPHPDEEWQHILRIEYNKNLFFGKLKIYVCSISKPTDAQLKTYTVKQMYDFGSVSSKFEKITAGQFGQKGDLYLHTEGDMPLASAQVTPEVQTAYDKYLTQYLIPALEKQKTSG